MGTAFGIALARAGLPVVPTFAALSVGYLVASRREVDSVVLPYLNRARLSYAARRFCDTGACVPWLLAWSPLSAAARPPPWASQASAAQRCGKLCAALSELPGVAQQWSAAPRAP